MDEKTWNNIIASFPEPHILQTWQWAQVKSEVGWKPIYKTWGNEGEPDAAALILQRTVSLGGFAARLRVLYIPKGPLLRDWNDANLRKQVLDDLDRITREMGAIFIKMDPNVPLGTGIPGQENERENPIGTAVLGELETRGWRLSEEQIQFRNTVLIDLSLSEDELLARMKQKTRYNLRLASRKGVKVRVGSRNDLGMLYRMYAETSLRDGFVIRDEGYYHNVWQTFLNADMLEPLIAEVDDEPVAAVMIFRFAGKAYYMHGMSTEFHREKMPNYVLQWEAIRHSRAAGCSVYDMWGAPEIFNENDPMWGVFRFKAGLGGNVLRTIGAYDLPVKPVYYKLYTQILPRFLKVLRQRGNMETRQALNS